jgi:putative tryptophan/tyrosine transport system substrate-binding protein
MNNRRKFITLLGGAAATWPLSARAQHQRKRIIGLLAAASPKSAEPQYLAILNGLRELGYTEGRDFEIVWKSAFGVMNRLPALAEELVSLKPDVLIGAPGLAVVALHKVTTTIPILGFMLADEIRLGLVASIARPGGNVTGLSMRLDGMIGKQIELATELVPRQSTVGILFNPTSVEAINQFAEARIASANLRLVPIPVEASAPSEIDSALQRFKVREVAIAVVLYDALFFQERKQIAELAVAKQLPMVYAARDHVIEGGLISYGVSLQSNAHRMTAYIDKILKGANAADLPVEFPTQLELVINLKTAKALGLEIPPTLLARADEVIE